MSLRGRTAIVTGASRGIGRAIAQRLGSAGAHVVVHYHENKDAADEVATAIRTAGGQAVTAAADLGEPADIRALYALTQAEFGGLDIVVNNAAMIAGGPIEHFAVEDFDRLVAVNLRGVYVSCQEAARRLSEGGRIINLSAKLPAAAIPILGVYGAAKAGVEVLTRSLAHQLGPRGITVNAVAPGPTDTDMLAPDARANIDSIAAHTPLRRIGQPADVAAVVAFLTDIDSGWITGQTIHANGGID
ncbi:MAG TPA: SDR family oxidoreductase [Pseudonocardiaceae bacterium]|nr:SDR family oxidoreductase [Pseudonocardiaceae bacterium]